MRLTADVPLSDDGERTLEILSAPHASVCNKLVIRVRTPQQARERVGTCAFHAAASGQSRPNTQRKVAEPLAIDCCIAPVEREEST
jgi:hypothetical protein